MFVTASLKTSLFKTILKNFIFKGHQMNLQVLCKPPFFHNVLPILTTRCHTRSSGATRKLWQACYFLNNQHLTYVFFVCVCDVLVDYTYK